MIRAGFSLKLSNFTLDARFEAPGTGITALFGRSGSGKTTLLRCAAGLMKSARGAMAVNGQVWQDSSQGMFVPSHRRAVGYVFQEASLFAHLSVRGNLNYGFRRVPAAERTVDFDQVVELLGVARFLERAPHLLSGGERQRVAIARALLTSPRLLLLDEPLSGLDATSKTEIYPYLQRLRTESKTPMLYVSHSVEEVTRLADHVVLLEEGRVKASGTRREMLEHLGGNGDGGQPKFHLSIGVPSLDEAMDFFVRILRAAVLHRDSSGYVNLDLYGCQLTLKESKTSMGNIPDFHFGVNLGQAEFEGLASHIQAIANGYLVGKADVVDEGTAMERRKMVLRAPGGYLVEVKGRGR